MPATGKGRLPAYYLVVGIVHTQYRALVHFQKAYGMAETCDGRSICPACVKTPGPHL